MPTAYVDTGAWIALIDEADRYHRDATRFFRSLVASTRLVTSNYVVAETITWLLYHDGHSAALRLKDMLAAAIQQGLLVTAWIGEGHHQLGWALIERFSDQRLSFCDATSFVVANERGVDFVFGFDHQFRVAGFDLRPGP